MRVYGPRKLLSRRVFQILSGSGMYAPCQNAQAGGLWPCDEGEDGVKRIFSFEIVGCGLFFGFRLSLVQTCWWMSGDERDRTLIHGEKSIKAWLWAAR
jgi:hypothetical protein